VASLRLVRLELPCAHVEVAVLIPVRPGDADLGSPMSDADKLRPKVVHAFVARVGEPERAIRKLVLGEGKAHVEGPDLDYAPKGIIGGGESMTIEMPG
jgi:hypothetical protein